MAGDQSPAQILEDLDRAQLPSFDPAKNADASYSREFSKSLKDATERRAALILKLFQAAPDHERIPTLMAERWSVRPYGLPKDTLRKEVDEVLARTRNQRLRIEGMFARSYARIFDRDLGSPPDLSIIDDFLKMSSNDPRGAVLLDIAAKRADDAKTTTALEDRILRDFPDSLYARKIRGIRHRGELIGKSLNLDFIDVATGRRIALNDFRGRVVVIEFWATWCGPCVAEIPRMKEIYAKYHEKGVEFVGISLDRPADQGGRMSLLKFIKENGVAWPHYYQGNDWDSEFSCACGVTSIPAIFVLDARGKVRSTDARGDLEKVIVKLLDSRGTLGSAR
jgi:thiol-disulfide isomerase/thioredoxin